MICDRYDTAVVPFPFAEQPVLKRRPVVVLSGRSFNQSNDATIVAMITTAKATVWPSDILIQDLQSASLNAACVIRWRMATIPNDLILQRLGTLAGRDRQACERELAAILV
ncbi:type II toxin-antitoxin system PemK/MazF family toxin [Rhizobium sp. SSA_523]|uniref:type II toxin-antitoxin system PemK/MazF family toxin n=1 Tax=Rhizobium sp. SSA_523 TaxID=2952477 RepID=UPI0020901168|nr:type II toxin-antitoxin system PemK/MazF family toxin [Rhizobium sp. SSA_523]MCO5730422.1 type II toxin-antitoxin system PemK/MazF family toxin [Rhizobium sp. SSA_523]WKC25465.1 type II toxin-antitoxin system PemK/MazF family toxin [Rhizobium sp. SSA_523]